MENIKEKEEILKRINAFLKQNNYRLLCHDCPNIETARKIMKTGLKKGGLDHCNSRFEVMQIADIDEENLLEIENTSESKQCRMASGRLYVPIKGSDRTTVLSCHSISMADLLEEGHLNGTGCVILCVPSPKSMPPVDGVSAMDYHLGNCSNYFESGDNDIYERTRVIYSKEDKYLIQHMYPKEAILFLFDKKTGTIQLNKNFDETVYFSNICPVRNNGKLEKYSTGITVRKGSLYNSLHNIAISRYEER